MKPKFKVGDKIRLTGEVANVFKDGSGGHVHFDGAFGYTLFSDTALERAELIERPVMITKEQAETIKEWVARHAYPVNFPGMDSLKFGGTQGLSVSAVLDFLNSLIEE